MDSAPGIDITRFALIEFVRAMKDSLPPDFLEII